MNIGVVRGQKRRRRVKFYHPALCSQAIAEGAAIGQMTFAKVRREFDGRLQAALYNPRTTRTGDWI
jgi:hypothetical protein